MLHLGLVVPAQLRVPIPFRRADRLQRRHG